MIDVETTPFGGSKLVRAALAGDVPADWYTAVPASPGEWRAAAVHVTQEFAGRDWLGVLAPALNAQGAALERLTQVAQHKGVVVTTGQQPGLFGGPLYTFSKALSALALANTLQEATGMPVAPVFWAATDDADFVEASSTVVAHNGAVHTLRMPPRDTGPAMADLPLGDVTQQYEMLARAAGSVVDHAALRAVVDAYRAEATVGGAYVTLLRTLLQPLGIAVLDAAHPVVRMAGASVMRAALDKGDVLSRALRERETAIEALGFKAQVQIVPHLTLVFRNQDGKRTRIALKDAPQVLAGVDAVSLGPNVLLRPVMERQILPTVTYVAGPGEYAYFAQVSVVADILNIAVPRVVPRWSGRILEPHVQEILIHIQAQPDDFRDPHAVETRIARQEMPHGVREAFANLRTSLHEHAEQLRKNHPPSSTLQKSVGSFEIQVSHRIDRLERRHSAAIKREGTALLHDVAAARASLYPNGAPQERVLNVVPFLARYGDGVREQMLSAASVHALAIVQHGLPGVATNVPAGAVATGD